MRLSGYTVKDLTPWEDASEGKAVVCEAPQQKCSASFAFHGTPGRHDIAILYFDVNGGEARFQLAVGHRVVKAWTAEHFPNKRLNGDSATRLTIPNIELQPNDVITLEGIPDGDDPAALDYIEVK
jgi:alpha-glucuronidase